LFYLTILAIGALMVMGLLDLARSRIMARVSAWLERSLAPEALSRSVSAALRGRDYQAQSLRDVAAVRSVVAGPAMLALFDGPWVPIYLGAVYLLHPVMGYVALAGTVILFALAVLNVLATRRPLATANAMAISAMRHVETTMRNAEAVDAMGMTRGVLSKWLDRDQQVLDSQRRASDRSGTILALARFARFTVQISVLGAGAYLVLAHEITAGSMIAASIIMWRALAPVEQAISTWKDMAWARSAYRRLKALLDEQPYRAPGIALPKPHGHLSVEKVTFVPPGAEMPSLHGVSFYAEPGQTTAIVGPSASGKSTLCRLIVGSWKPTRGVVRLDGADVFNWDHGDLGSHVGYLPQDVELFAGTVAENISRLNGAGTDSEMIVEAAKAAGVHDMVLRLPDGYGTEIGDGGAILSSGQRQRIALARALFGDPSLIVLDEPNSNLDSEGEARLIEAIRNAKQRGATVIVVAHRQSLLEVIDRIVVLQGGLMRFAGARDEVLRSLQASLAPLDGSRRDAAPRLAQQSEA
jgi:PrtD family type I secretion system ABC transporter